MLSEVDFTNMTDLAYSTVRNKAVYWALGVQPDGTKEVLGLWIEQTEGAKFWLRVMTKLKNRGINEPVTTPQISKLISSVISIGW